MKIYLADDEPLAAAKLKLFLEKLGEGPDISMFDNGVSALAAVERETPDLLFLDIQMPGLTGMEVIERARQRGNDVMIVITSAYDEYALPSFGFNVTDYLLKPYTIDRLKQALDKVHNNLRLRQLDQTHNATTLSIRCDGRTIQLYPADVLYLEAEGDYTRISTRDGQRYMVLGTLSSFEGELPEGDFVRVHRSNIINISAVSATSSQSVTMCDGAVFTVGRTYREQIGQLFGKKR